MIRLPIFIILILLLVAFILRIYEDSDIEEFVDYIVENEYLNDEFSNDSKGIIELMLQAHDSKLNASVNEVLSDNSINLYLVDIPDDIVIPKRIRHLVDQTAYTGFRNVILVDVANVKRLASIKTTYYSPPSDSVKWMLKWIVGHEVGHIIAGHIASHYEQNNDSVQPFSQASINQEHEADSLFASAIRVGASNGSVSEDIEENLSRFLIDYMEIQYANEVGDVLQAGPMQFISEVPFKKSDASTHAEYFIRAGRMLTQTKHDSKEIFIQAMPKMEEFFYKQDLNSGGKFVMSGKPENAIVSLELGDTVAYSLHRRAPIKVWIPPNQYQANISLPGYQDKIINFSVEPGQVTKLHFTLEEDSEYPHHLDKKYENVSNSLASYFGIYYPFSENAEADLPNIAAEQLEKLVVNNRNWFVPRLKLALIYLEQMDCESSIDIWSAGIRQSLASSDLSPHKTVGTSIKIDIFEHRLSKNPTNEYLVLNLIRLYADMEDYAKSLSLAAERLPSQDSDRIVKFYKFLHLWKNELNYDKALKVITDLIDGGGEVYFRNYYIADSLNLLLAELSEEIADNETAQGIYSSQQDVDLLFEFYLRQQQFDTAEFFLRSFDANQLDRTYQRELFCDLTTALFSVGEQEWARKLFDQYKLETTSANCLIAAGYSHIEEGDIDQALYLCEKANGFDSLEEEFSALECIADAKDAKQLKAEALHIKSEALWLNPLNPLLLKEIANRNESIGNSEKAICYQQLFEVYNSFY